MIRKRAYSTIHLDREWLLPVMLSMAPTVVCPGIYVSLTLSCAFLVGDMSFEIDHGSLLALFHSIKKPTKSGTAFPYMLFSDVLSDF
jgi:hypothetical protein